MGLFGKSNNNDDLPESPMSIQSGKPEDRSKKTATASSGISLPSWSTFNSDDSAKSHAKSTKRSKKVVYGRAIFVLCLAVVAVVLGYLAFLALCRAQEDLWQRQFESMVTRALAVTRTLATNKFQHGTMVMSQVAAFAHPDASSWPFVWVDGYWKIAENVIPTSAYTGIHLAPIVQPEQAPAFEAFAYAKFEETFGADTQMANESHFGRGIWVKDGSIDTVDNRYHDTTGQSIHGSPYEFLAPKLQHGLVQSPYLMMNVHGFRRQGQAVDAVVNCTLFERDANTTHNCQAFSPFNPPKMHSQTGPFGFIATPIFPANDPDTLVGFIFGAVFWSEVMEEMFPEDVRGIDCVFHTEDEFYTYSITGGSGQYLGEGDLHDPAFDEYGMEQVLVEPETMAAGSQKYVTKCYPNEEFVSIYVTNAPLWLALGCVGIILFVSLLFFIYDRCVRQEFNAKKELLEAKRQFVRFVSHEVRTPLNSVSMGLTLMKEEMAQSLGYKSAEDLLETPEKKAHAPAITDKAAVANGTEWFNLAHEVHTSAQSSVDVLNDLLNYDKIENGQLALEYTVVPIWSLLDRTMGEFKLPMTSKSIDLHLNLPALETDAASLVSQGKVRDQKVIGDTVRITQVLRNLVSNAIKFTPEGGDIRVAAKWEKSVGGKSKEQTFELKDKSVVSHESTGTLVVTVKDSGVGMTKSQLKNLFGQGIQFNVNELQHGNGSGLGLYIAMGIVQQHGGSLTCDSEGLGRGTTFTMKLPVFDIPAPESPKRGEAGEEGGDLDFEDETLNILIVDDAVSNRKLLQRLLKLKGHQTAEAENGQIAVDMVQKAEKANQHYDLVLMDYEMPVMIGPDAAQAIRDHGSDVFIIGVTGNLMPEDVSFFRQCGANAVLPKPFRMTELDDIIFEHQIEPHAMTNGELDA